MRFTFEGSTYTIEFQRSTHFHRVFDPISNAEKEIPSRYKYTTARLVLNGATKAEDIVFRTATVGCYFKETTFSKEQGRLKALRDIARTLPKALKPLMFSAYHSRPKG